MDMSKPWKFNQEISIKVGSMKISPMKFPAIQWTLKGDTLTCLIRINWWALRQWSWADFSGKEYQVGFVETALAYLVVLHSQPLPLSILWLEGGAGCTVPLFLCHTTFFWKEKLWRIKKVILFRKKNASSKSLRMYHQLGLATPISVYPFVLY